MLICDLCNESNIPVSNFTIFVLLPDEKLSCLRCLIFYQRGVRDPGGTIHDCMYDLHDITLRKFTCLFLSSFCILSLKAL